MNAIQQKALLAKLESNRQQLGLDHVQKLIKAVKPILEVNSKDQV